MYVVSLRCLVSFSSLFIPISVYSSRTVYIIIKDLSKRQHIDDRPKTSGCIHIICKTYGFTRCGYFTHFILLLEFHFVTKVFFPIRLLSLPGSFIARQLVIPSVA
ncbi:hypothetical protein F4678DRAFT_271137 [Xylaria arbuscula]|nr:hypothetical protein F4678DRAFT_271137 [Xylaria arbuscula]